MRHEATKTPPPFVEISVGGYMLDLLMEAGPVKSMPMGGFQALDWVDISAFASLTMDHIEIWEAKLLREMSDAFAVGLSEGTSAFSKAPADRTPDKKTARI